MKTELNYDQKINVVNVAKILDLSFDAEGFIQELQKRKIFVRNRCLPKQKFLNKGYFLVVDKEFEPNNHNFFILRRIYVTDKGLAFIARQFNVVLLTRRVYIGIDLAVNLGKLGFLSSSKPEHSTPSVRILKRIEDLDIKELTIKEFRYMLVGLIIEEPICE